MHPFLVALNALWEDTSVLVVVAYLLTRGRLLTFVFPSEADAAGKRSWANVILSGAMIGMAGATEYLFPNLRYPYATPTLFITFAAFSCSLRVGWVTTVIILLGAIAANTSSAQLGAIAVASIASLIIGNGMGNFNKVRWQNSAFNQEEQNRVRNPGSLLVALVAGMLSEAVALGARWGFAYLTKGPLPDSPHSGYYLVSIPANGVGMALLQLIVREAWQRTEADRLRREAAAARAFAAQQQLVALRARVHPHFLFNTLNSIASLCAISPEHAETATVKLGEVMRRALEAPTQPLTMLRDEIDDVRTYIDIERYRYGERLGVVWRIAPGTDAACVPPFALATLIDNAINHGIAPKRAGGCIVVTLRRLHARVKTGRKTDAVDHVLVAVQDDGVGMSHKGRASVVSPDLPDATAGRSHGLMLLDQQLRLLMGNRARLRLFSQPGHGTLAVFAVPLPTPITGLSSAHTSDAVEFETGPEANIPMREKLTGMRR